MILILEFRLDSYHEFTIETFIERYKERVEVTGDCIIFDKQVISDEKMIVIDKLKYCKIDTTEKCSLVYNRRLRIGTKGHIKFLDSSLSLVVDSMNIKYSSEPLYINGKISSKTNLIEGDIIQVSSIRIVIYAYKVLIYANSRRYRTILNYVVENDSESLIATNLTNAISYNRGYASQEIELLDPPQEKVLNSKNLLLSFLPSVLLAVITLVIGLLRGQGVYLIISISSTLISVLSGIIKFKIELKSVKVYNYEREKLYDEYLETIKHNMNELNHENHRISLQLQVDSLVINKHLSTMTPLVFCQSINDWNYLHVSLGLSQMKSGIRFNQVKEQLKVTSDPLDVITQNVRDSSDLSQLMPLIFDLKKNNLGIVGEFNCLIDYLMIFIERICFLHSNQELVIVPLLNDGYMKYLEYLSWYPHTIYENDNLIYLIHNKERFDSILMNIYSHIKSMKSVDERTERTDATYFLFICDHKFKHPLLQFLEDNDKKTCSFIVLADTVQNLPKGMSHVIKINSNTSSFYLNMKLNEITKLDIGKNNIKTIEQNARLMSSIELNNYDQYQLPELLTFYDMYKVTSAKKLLIKEYWSTSSIYKTMSVPIGVNSFGLPIYLDLHESYDGPHGLIAGMTGSGKSEFIQTLILSLSVKFSPEEIGFLLIDYKGGGMSSAFGNLPHVLGELTNLDTQETQRVLVSIKAELKRRQVIFLENRVKNINMYHRLRANGNNLKALPHIVIISDEFAELKKEQPDFMKELVSVARLGRSLGIHLILATQKPSGVVDDQIWSNSKFQIALKVQSNADSVEMLKTKDASRIKEIGRAYLKVGESETYELFQSAYSGALVTNRQDKVLSELRVIHKNGIEEKIDSLEYDSYKPLLDECYQIDEVIDEINNTYKTLNLSKIDKPWLPSLPAKIEQLFNMELSNSNLSIPIGLIDLPEAQQQKEYIHNMYDDGHLLYVASTGYGKTEFLKNCIQCLSNQHAISKISIHILDFGTSGLIQCSQLNSVVNYHELGDEEIINWFSYIEEIITKRKRAIADRNVSYVENGDVEEMFKKDCHIICIDNVELIKECGFEYESKLARLMRDGNKTGLRFILTANQSADIRYSILNQIKAKIVGYTIDKSESTILLGKSEWAVQDLKGRALIKTDTIHVIQLYTISTINRLIDNINDKGVI